MRKRYVFYRVAAAILLMAGVLLTGSNASAQPGTAEDPLVSKAYVDDQIRRLEERYSGTTVGPATQTGGYAYQPLQLLAGQMLIGGEGAEIILRSGQATAFSGVANGLSDVTAGADIGDGQKISSNHVLIVPRYDSRGIKATTDIWVMIRGDYQVVE